MNVLESSKWQTLLEIICNFSMIRENGNGKVRKVKKSLFSTDFSLPKKIVLHDLLSAFHLHQTGLSHVSVIERFYSRDCKGRFIVSQFGSSVYNVWLNCIAYTFNRVKIRLAFMKQRNGFSLVNAYCRHQYFLQKSERVNQLDPLKT